jgi:hypothetical protein
MSDEPKRHVAHAGAVLLQPVPIAERPLPPERQPAPLPELSPAAFAKLRETAWPSGKAPADVRRCTTKFKREPAGQAHLFAELAYPVADGTGTFNPALEARRATLADRLATARADYLAHDPAPTAARALKASLEGIRVAEQEAQGKVEKLTAAFAEVAKVDSKSVLATADKLTSAKATLATRRELVTKLEADLARAERAALTGLADVLTATRKAVEEELAAERHRLEEEWLAVTLPTAAALYAAHTILAHDLAGQGALTAYGHLD